MSKITPASRPQATKADILKIIKDEGLDIAAEKLILVGIRGYYTKTMGDPLKNDRNLYDDAMFVVTEKDLRSYNCNVDPSKYKKGIASLVVGIYKAVKWMHHGKYRALQIVRDDLVRDSTPGHDIGRHGINFHYGGDRDTWSEGCQTFPQSQYWQFQGHVYELMDQFGLKEVTYLLVEA
jgi:hypothetical protein